MKIILNKLTGILLIFVVVIGCNSKTKADKNSVKAKEEGIYEGIFIDVRNTEIPDTISTDVFMEKHLFSNINLTESSKFWGSKNDFSLFAMGSIEIPESNTYFFRMSSVGKIQFKLNNKDLIVNKKIHDKESDFGETYLEKGFTIFEYEYYPSFKDPYLVLEWSKDGINYDVIPDQSFNNLDAFNADNWTDDNLELDVEFPDNVLSDKEKTEGWKLLFDGETTKGWHTYNKPGTIGRKWKAKAGMLVFEGRDRFEFIVAGRKIELGPTNKVLDGGEDIVTDDAYENFVLSLEWKISEAGNNGIFYTVQEDDQYDENYYTSPEMQVQDDQKHKDGLIYKHRAGDLYDLIASDPVRVKPMGNWNNVRIIKNRGKIEHWLNGTKVLNFDLNSDAWKDMISKSKFSDLKKFASGGPGKIGFQDHDNKVYYKNIKMKELK